MRRILLVVLVLFCLILAAWWWGRDWLPPTATLANGATLTIVDVQVGPYESASPPRDPFYVRMFQLLPSTVQRYLSPPNAGGSSSGRSYYTDSDQTRALQLWFRVLTNGQPVDPRSMQRKIFLCDDQGWLYPSVGWANSGGGAGPAEFICHTFSVFPRRQSTIDMVMANEDSPELELRLTFNNPDHLVSPRTNWSVGTLPQDRSRDGIQFRLTSLNPNPNKYPYRDFEKSGLEGPPSWTPTFTSREPDGTENTWHLIQDSFYDNYLNHSLEGLPPRRSSEDGLDDLQWQVRLVMAADHNSTYASNRFWELPPMAIPAPGELTVLDVPDHSLSNLDLHLCAFAGKGILTMTNGVVKGIQTPPYEITGKSSSSSSQGYGDDESVTLEFTRPDPHLFFQITGSRTNNYFTCRAIDMASGSVTWLGSYGSKTDEPIFQRLFNPRDLLEMDCKSLTVGKKYRFILGVHPPKTVDFYIQAPIYNPLE